MGVPVLQRIGHWGKAFNYEAVTVSSSAVGLTSTKYNPSGHKAQVAFITVEGAQIRFRYDGTDPTSSEGHLFSPGDVLELIGFENIENFKAIRVGSTDATLRVTYEE